MRRRFWPLFVVQATGGLNDNLYKSAVVILLVFRGEGGAGLSALAGALFILPYAALSATAGQVADRYDKARSIQVNKGCEVLLMGFAAWALTGGGAVACLLVLFGLGVQAAAFGPLKYGILPQHLRADELLLGNALIEAATFGVILLGTIAGGLLVGVASGPGIVAAAGLVSSAVGFGAALLIPPAPGSRAVAVELNPLPATLRSLRAARANGPVWRATLGLSWFWALGATYLALFPVLVRDVFHAAPEVANQVVTLLLASFSVGIGLGAMAGSRLLRGEVSFRLVLPAGAVLAGCTVLFGALTMLPGAARFATPGAIAGAPMGALALLLLFGASVAGGAFSVPLNAVIQRCAEPDACSRMVAANNVMNAVFMVGGAAAVAVLAAVGLAPGATLVLAGLASLGVAVALPRGGAAGLAPRFGGV